MQQRKLEIAEGDMFFSLKDVTYSPETPKMNEPFIIKGRVELLKIPFLAPIWVIATATYPEKWWEEIVPIIGAPTVSEMSMVIGGDFEVTYPKGFTREGEYSLTVKVYAGPTIPINKWTLPPFPPVATYDTTFIVSGEVIPPEEVWEMVEAVSVIIVEAGPEVTVWEMVEEVSGVIIEVGPEISVWEMVEEVLGIVIRPAPEIAIWEKVEEVSGIIVTPIAPMVGWYLVEEIRGIFVAPTVLAEYSITTRVSPSGVGYVTKEPYKVKYASGESVKLTAYPYSGYKFSYWESDGELLSYGNPINFLVVARDYIITAHFVRR